jgi:dTDP-4-dehydrorhamnose reductase
VLILGATGMLGQAMRRVLADAPGLEVIASVRGEGGDGLIGGIDAESVEDLARLFDEARPEVAINCVGLVKQNKTAEDVLAAVPINTLLPHRLARLCRASGARLVHFSTDCVFSGAKGNYTEEDLPDADDVYGRSKVLGEVAGPGALTLRTSMVGHETRGHLGLLEWFLAEKEPVNGYAKMIFSGLPTDELARIVRDHVIPRPGLEGLYHVSAARIAKLDLLRLFAAEYGKEIEIVPDDKVAIDRSLDSARFRAATGYEPPSWPELVAAMHEFGRA